jgi:hypothetical protein
MRRRDPHAPVPPGFRATRCFPASHARRGTDPDDASDVAYDEETDDDDEDEEDEDEDDEDEFDDDDDLAEDFDSYFLGDDEEEG